MAMLDINPGLSSRVRVRQLESAPDQRECGCRSPCAPPARSERFTVSRDRAHSTGVESTTQTSSVQTLVSRASLPVSQFKVPARRRSRLL